MENHVAVIQLNVSKIDNGMLFTYNYFNSTHIQVKSKHNGCISNLLHYRISHSFINNQCKKTCFITILGYDRNDGPQFQYKIMGNRT